MRSFLGLSIALAFASAAIAPSGCADDVRPVADEPTYRGEVATILGEKCARCHADGAPAAGFRVDTYPGAIGCTDTGKVAVLPADAAPIVTVLSTPDHAGFTTDAERATLARWVATGAQSVRAGVHPKGFADPRSPSSHVALLRATRYRALTDRNDRNACARCHEGAGPRPSDVIASAPGATACTTCHTDPNGVNACSTCHGAPGRGFPPRDPCFYPTTDANRDAHAAHAAPSAARATPLDCAACHPKPVVGQLGGTHADGYVEVWFDYAAAGRNAQFDPNARRCTGTCHDRGGTNPTPTWASGNPPLDCNSCHTSPPPAHFSGPCSGCHKEANATGTALVSPVLHVNGRVDLGDGSGGCGACHGTGNDPWPTTGAHPAHKAPAGSVPVPCETCHTVPGPQDAHPLRAGAAMVHLAGLATKNANPASYDPATKTCASTYCHDGPGAKVSAPRWDQGEPARTCGGCHSTPPPAPHPQLSACGLSSCHQGVTDTSGLVLTPAGRTVHVNGFVDRSAPP